MARFDKLEFNPNREPDPDLNGPRHSNLDAVDWLKRADEHRRVGHYENALKYYSRALEEDKSIVDGWVGQVQMLIQLDEHPEADLWSRKALELFPSNGDLLAGRAQALCRMADLKNAHAACDGAIAQSGQSAYRWMVRGEIMVAGRQETDGYCFDKAQQMDSDWLVPLEIALIYLYYRSWNKALLRARRAVEAATDCYYPWYVQGNCLFKLGLEEPARKSFRQCLELCPNHLDARGRLTEMEVGKWSVTQQLRRWFRRS
ncbi:MAG: tetratricopeptide repeat protein [Pirellulaceae bacterium]|nr:tetratricopeptide repeat protein [Pirellulaceae bacterium]